MDLSLFEGQIFIGTVLTTALWGIGCMQTLFYFATYESDKSYVKRLVAALCVLDAVHEILCVKASWSIFVSRFGDKEISVPPEIFYQLIVTSVVTLLTNLFFVWRIWRFTESWMFLVIPFPPIIGHLGCSILYTSKGLGKPENTISTQFMTRLALGILAMEFAVDMFIAVAMSIILWKSRAGLPRTDRMILRLIHLSVANGACFIVFGIVGFVAVLRWSNDWFYWIGEIASCALYCNVVLASLNSRKYIASTDMMIDPFAGWSISGPSLSPSVDSFDAPRDISLEISTDNRRAEGRIPNKAGNRVETQANTVRVDRNTSKVFRRA